MLAVIDASPVGGGPVARALACAASEAHEPDVLRLRSFDLFATVCVSCSDCVSTGRCTRHHPALDDALARLAEADSLLVGTTDSLHARDARARALLVRLVGSFGHVEVARGLHGSPSAAGHKRAAIVCAAPAALSVPAMLGMLPAHASGVWKVLERSGASVVGCASVATRWSGPASRDRAAEPARALGRKLAAGPARAKTGAPQRGERLRPTGARRSVPDARMA